MNRSSISRLLLATDFSNSAMLAHVYAEYLALTFGASLDILHVNERPRDRNAGEILKEEGRIQTQLWTLQDGLRKRGVPVTVRSVTGDPSAQILSAAQQLKADVIAMGMQGDRRLPYGLIGATVETVTKAGLCPVLTVPLPQKEASPCIFPAPGAIMIRNILVPVDFSTPSLDSLEYAVHLAKGLGAHLVLLHVVEPAHMDWDLTRMEEGARRRSSWEDWLAELVEDVQSLGLSATYDVRGGLPPDSILAGALRHQCDLIVMGTHGRQGRDRANVGSVAEAVLKQTTCPVLTVKDLKVMPGDRRVIPTVLSREVDESRRD